MEELPDDLLLEILFRVKDVVPATLFRCAAVCTHWRDLVAEPAFLRRCWPDQDVSSSLVGFFTPPYTWRDPPTPCFTPTPRSALQVPRRRDLESFMTAAAPVGVFDGAVPLVSRHGLLLVRLNTKATRGYPNPIVLDMAVCNLLTGTCHMLPTLKFGPVILDECEWNGYAISTATDCRSNQSNSSFFKVVIVSTYNKNGMQCSLHTFSSGEESWSVHTKCFHDAVQPYKHGSSSRAVMRRGTAHWLFRYWENLYVSVLNINMGTGHISLVKLPFQINCDLDNQPCLTLAANGALSLLCMQNTGTKLEIWEQKDEQPSKDGGSEWVCIRTVELKELMNRENEIRELRVLGEKCGTLLINDTIQAMYTADLQTGMMEEVADWPRRVGRIIPRETLPLEVDWPGIFSSRLGTRKQKMETLVTYPPGWELMYLQGIERRKIK